MADETQAATLARLIDKAKRAVVFTGAGISTESGIPDFRCPGHVKTATVSFGQAMPPVAMRRAEEESLAADLFIVLGSSLVVYPAAGFPELAKRNGATLAIVNREETPLDRVADLVLHRPIG